MNFSGKDLQKRGLVVPDCVQHKSLHLGERHTYALLVQLSGNGDRCWPSQRYLADRIGVSVRSVQNYLQQLEKLGFIAVTQGKDGETNTYRLLPHPLVQTELARRQPQPIHAAKPLMLGHEKIAEGDGAKAAPVIKREEKNTPLTPQQGDGRQAHAAPTWKTAALAEFERLWTAWPIQEARTAALRWWMRLKRLGLLPPLEKILRLIQEHRARNPRWLRGFVPFLATWLKNRRWEDAAPAKPVLPGSDKVSTPVASASARTDPKAVGLQGGRSETAALSAACPPVPDGVWEQLNAVLSVWPGELTEAQLCHVRGTWRYLHSQGRLPAPETLLQIAQATTANFSRWLYGYQFHDRRHYSA
ncbi:helix-turn-helix domain-containing protein [Desulfovibrio sp. TomC]|uniref:helix-turn-helix domain-containing protein n=1 Tax=Desulfovibrio sp. TomC TaxID=1562888 RepID=UPI00057445DC|nr:helix-turn-helix domain-containing protein [Desulfovibrio sp. TomC]KHK00260.1 hypothetical protein NY78_4342 [Desulfovibrio sp. TomC]